MALHTLGTKAATQLACLSGWSTVLLPADMAAINQAIQNDAGLGAIPSGYSAGPYYVMATATTAGTPSLTVVTARAGSPPITQIRVGDTVVGSAADIVPGTYVAAVSGTTVTLSQNAVSTGTLKGVMFVHQSTFEPGLDQGSDQLYVPNRGVLKILPGDVVATDSSGWTILVSGNSIAYAGSDWTFT